MALFNTGIHKDHMYFLKRLAPDILLSFVKASVDYFFKGPNIKSYTDVAKKFNVSPERIQEAVESLAYLFIECYKHQVSFLCIISICIYVFQVDREKLAAILREIGFTEGQIEAIIGCYEEQFPMIEKLFIKPSTESFFYDLQWRFEAKIASRALLNQLTPLVTLNLKTSDHSRAAVCKKITNEILQTDPCTLIQITNTLEKALQLSQSNVARKMEKKIKKLASMED